MRYLGLAIAILFVATLALMVAARADEIGGDPSHFWISKNPDYKRKSGTHCCGPGHCREIPEDWVRVEVDEDGVTVAYHLVEFAQTRYGVQTFKVGERALYDSINRRYWACIDSDGEAHCLFPPKVVG